MTGRRSHGPEEALQRAIVNYLHVALPPPPDGPVWTAVNPVSAKSKAAAGVSKAMGLRAGFPDLIFVWRGRTIAVEVKAPRGSRSPEQRDTQNGLTLAGAVVLPTCKSVEQLYEFLAAVGIPLKARPT